MQITLDMLRAALKKAIEAGLLRRNSTAEELEDSMQIMHAIVEAALDAASDKCHEPLTLRPPEQPAERGATKES